MTKDRSRDVARSRHREELLHQLFSAAPSAMVLVSAEGTICLANQAARVLFGYESSDLVGLPVEELVPAGLRAGHVSRRTAYMRAPTARGMGVGRDLFGRRRDGTEVPIEIGLNPVATEDGNFVLAAIVDLTQRKQFEASLQRSEERLRAVVESAPSAMLMVDRAGRILLVNAGAEALFGWPREELVGRPVDDLLPARYRIEHPGHRARFFAAPSTRPMGMGRDLYGLRRDGTEVPIEIGLNPIATPEGLCVLAAVIDITQRKLAEEQMQRSLREKETLLREVHHRVKNNMQVVSSILGLHSGHVEDPQQVAVLEACRSRVKSMALVHEKLYLGENLAAIAFDDYVRELSLMLAEGQAAIGRVALQVRAQPVRLDVDTAIPVGLVFHELVTNALKHAFAGGRAGTIAIDLAVRPDGRVELSVANDGVVLPERFDLQSSATLGVRVIRSLVRQLDAEFTFARAPQTVFRLVFPNHTNPESVE